MRAGRGRITPGMLPWVFAFFAATTARADVLEISPAGHIAWLDRPVSAAPLPAPPVEGLKPRSIVPTQLDSLFAVAGKRARLSPDLIASVAMAESSLNPRARSPKGAAGVMQLMPGTAAQLGVNALDTEQNVTGGAVYLQSLLYRFHGDIPLALAAYNAGPEAVRRYGGIPPWRETRDYVSRVLDRLAALADVVQEDRP